MTRNEKFDKYFPNIEKCKCSFSQKRLQVSDRSHTSRLIGHTGQNSNAFIVQILSYVFERGKTLKQRKNLRLLEHFLHQTGFSKKRILGPPPPLPPSKQRNSFIMNFHNQPLRRVLVVLFLGAHWRTPPPPPPSKIDKTL